MRMDALLKSLGDSLAGHTPIPDPGDTVENLGLGAGGPELPRDVDEVMQVLESQMSGEPIKPEVTVEERIEKCKEKQTYLESRYRRLQTRINALRAAKLSCQASEQLQSVVTSCDKRKARFNGDGPEPRVPVVKSEVPVASPGKIEAVKKESEDKVVDSSTASDNGDKAGDIKPKKPTSYRKRYNKSKTNEVLGQLHGQLRHVQNLLDPEATESSSGGESADEQEKYPQGAVLYTSIHERARYRWLAKRAQLASQWVWLQAQVSDLEYKIRQHTELYRAQRAAKGPVTLGEDIHSWPMHAKVASLPSVSSMDSVPLNSSPATRVYQRQRPGGDMSPLSDVGDNSGEEASMTCARTRPVKRVRRRRLIDTYGLHHAVPKAARLSSVSCGCLHPDQWCVLCLGRRSHTTQVDRTVHGRGEALALLDHSYHTVLSDMKEDTKLNVSLVESLASRRWLENHVGAPPLLPGQPAHIGRLVNINDKVEEQKKDKYSGLGGIYIGGSKRKYIKRKEREGKFLKKRKKKDSERTISRPLTPTELCGDLNIRTVKEGFEKIKDKNSLTEQLKKKRKSNYDIDHIVIPYSMAATTRVEKLQYKEIQTPSWKEVGLTSQLSSNSESPVVEKTQEPVSEQLPDVKEEPESIDSTPEDDDYEDISDLTFKLMHAKAEEEERVRWATPLGRVHGGQRGHHAVQARNRANRLDSCRSQASSGANTPNPLSPEAIEGVEDIVVGTRPSSPILPESGEVTPSTPQATPVPNTFPPLLSTSPGSCPVNTSTSASLMPTPLTTIPASLRGRRRTSSQTKSRDRNLSEASQQSQESSRSTSPWTEMEERITNPWEPRNFPLSEEEARDLEAEERQMLPPSYSTAVVASQSSTTVSATTSRTTSRTSSLDDVEPGDSADPDWEDNDDRLKEEQDMDDDPEYDPDTKEKRK